MKKIVLLIPLLATCSSKKTSESPIPISEGTPINISAKSAFAGWQTFVSDHRRQTEQLPNQMYELLPDEIKQNWAYVFCEGYTVPAEPKNIVLFANYTGFQDKSTYPDWAQQRHTEVLTCIEKVLKEHGATKHIVLSMTQGDSTNKDFSLKVRAIVQAKQDAITKKYNQPSSPIRFGADEQAVTSMAYSFGQNTPVDVIISNPKASQHYDGDRPADELVASKLGEIGLTQVTGSELKILVFTRRPGADNVDYQDSDSEQLKFDAAFLAKNPITDKTVIVDARLYNGAWDMFSVPKRCDYLAYSAWGTFANSFGSGAAIAKILYKINASSDITRKFILEAVAHDSIFQGYEEVQRSSSVHQLFINAGLTYDHYGDFSNDGIKKAYAIINDYTNKRMNDYFAKTDCFSGKKIILTPQRNKLFEAISTINP